MKKLFLLIAISSISLLEVVGNNIHAQEPLKLNVPELKAELTSDSAFSFDVSAPKAKTDRKFRPDFSFFKSKTNENVKPYRFMDDMTFVGIPLFVAGWGIKGDKAMFRQNVKGAKRNTQLLTDFKTGIDDYTQFFGPAMVVGLKLGGVEGRSDWPRLAASAALSYGFMAGFVNGIKYSAKELRPDGSTRNSWPSGHTATSFVGATILHKEYGLTRSPWYSIAGYGVATATGVMRVLNNRHWVSDVMSGAGLGILSGELGYAIGDLLFKGKGLLRNDLMTDAENPSFFAINMGVGLGSKDLEFGFEDVVDNQRFLDAGFENSWEKDKIDFRAATVVDAEGAYFFNKYVGVGGRFRVRAMSAKSFGKYADISFEDATDAWYGVVYSAYDNDKWDQSTAFFGMDAEPVTSLQGVVRSDHIAEFTGSVGLYFNIPVTKRFSIGTKLLLGRSITQDMEIDGHAEGNVMNINYDMKIKNGAIDKKADGSYDITLQSPLATGETYTDDWDYMTLSAKNSTSYGTGISLTYRYKSNFSWRLFCDYDYTKKDYTMTYDEFHYINKSLTPTAQTLISNPETSPYALLLDPIVTKKTKKMNYWTLGLSFLVNL
jgi:hypothetical protein